MNKLLKNSYIELCIPYRRSNLIRLPKAILIRLHLLMQSDYEI